MNASIPTPSFPRSRESKHAAIYSAPVFLLELHSKYLSKLASQNVLMVALIPIFAGMIFGVVYREGSV